MIVSLPMYDRAETRAANDALWNAISAELTLPHLPTQLTRMGDPWSHWTSDQLLLSQTCGLPYREQLHGTAHLVGAWSHPIECPPGYYYSVLIARSDDPRRNLDDFADARFAYNDPLSQSGWAAPQHAAQAQGWSFTNTIQSGAHRKSAQMVAENMADIAAIDAVSWAMMTRWDEYTRRLTIIETTLPTHALPLITAFPDQIESLRSAIRAALGTLPASVCQTLLISDLVDVTAQDYGIASRSPLT